MSGKKLINAVDCCVDDDLEGHVALNPGARLLQGHRVVVRADLEEVRDAGKVAVVSGGGSGHEPAFAGYVGRGMLAACCQGAVFASPPASEVLVAIRAVATNNAGGCLLLIPNYTGDRLNFGLAAERAQAEGIKVSTCIMGEDCAVTTTDKTAGRRGLTGMIVCLKIAGALAEEGKRLDDIADVIRSALNCMATIGVGLTPCYLPGGGPTFQLPDDEMELGLGAHGEAGVRRIRMMTAKETVQLMLDHMTSPNNPNHLALKKGDRAAVFINDMGGIAIMDLNIVAKEAIAYLESKGIAVVRALCAAFLSSLEMSGVHITVLRLECDDVTHGLDACTEAPCWPRVLLPRGVVDRYTPAPLVLDYVETDPAQVADTKWTLSTDEGNRIRAMLTAACKALVQAESNLNHLDSGSGDADCGSTHARGATAVLKELESVGIPEANLPVCQPALLTSRLAAIAERTMGGAAGGCYGLFFTGVSACLSHQDGDPQQDVWTAALREGIAMVKRYGGAEPGDRTMAAEEGSESTVTMKARAGRASYVCSSLLQHPDPGAVGVVTWLRAAYETFVATGSV